MGDPVRDRLYCDPEDGVGRRSAQTLLHYVLRVVLHTIAPILPHMADEFHHHRQDIRESDVSVMKLRWLTANDIINQVSSTSQSRMGRMFRDSLVVRKYVFTHTQLTSHDLKGMDIALEVGGGNVGESQLKTLKELLTELLGCATLDIRLVDDGDYSVTGWTLPPLPSVKRLIERQLWLMTIMTMNP